MYKTDMLAKLKANNANSTVIPIQFDGLDSDHIQKKKKDVWLTLSANALSLNESLRQSSILSPSCSSTLSRQCGPPDPAALPLDNVLGYDKAFLTEASSEPLALAILFSFERSRFFLLENLNPEPLLFFLVTVDGIDSSPSFICFRYNSEDRVEKYELDSCEFFDM
jgi:hypothetical protein